MRKIITFIIASTIAMSISSVAQARNTKYLLPIAPAMQTQVKAGSLDGSVKFYFADQAHPAILANLGTYDRTGKSDAFGNPDVTVCNWAFLTALVALQNRAHQVGANAVVNIVSYYKKKEMASQDKFECHSGASVSGVVLKGDFVKVAGDQ